MDNDDKSSTIPLLEDIETAVPTSRSTADDKYPVKPKSPGSATKKTHKKHHNKKSCCEKCCVTTIKVIFVLLFAFILMASFASIRAYKWISKEVQHWTVTEPNRSIPTADVSRAEQALFKARAELFWQTIQAGKKIPKDFVATARNINGLIAESDFLRGNAYTELHSNEVQISVSLPADGLPGGEGRFLVGTEIFTWNPETSMLHLTMNPMDENGEKFYDLTFSLEKNEDDDNNRLTMELVSGQILEWTVPQEFIDEHANLLDGIYQCDCHDEGCKRTRKFLEALTGVELEEDKIVVQARNEPTTTTTVAKKFNHGHRALRERNGRADLKATHGFSKIRLLRKLLS
eukprot:scaffold8212_cov93-Cylindrotheca_fusiformis.AAC.4